MARSLSPNHQKFVAQKKWKRMANGHGHAVGRLGRKHKHLEFDATARSSKKSTWWDMSSAQCQSKRIDNTKKSPRMGTKNK